MPENRSPASRLLGALISPAVEAVDPDTVIERIDVEHLVDRIDIDGLVQRVDVDALVRRLDVNALLARVDVDDLVARIDVNALLDGADVNALLADLDLNALLAAVDVDALAARVDVAGVAQRLDLDALLRELDLDALLARVDVPALVDRIDIDALVGRIEVAEVVRRIDVAEVVERIDVPGVIARIDVAEVVRRIDVAEVVERIDVPGVIARIDVAEVVRRIDVAEVVERIDVPGVIDRIDVDALVSRIDLDKQIESVDIPAIVQRAEIETMIAEATTGVASATLDLARKQVLGIDVLIERAADRVMRRPVRPAVRVDGKVDATGWPAGPLARSLAFFADAALVAALFSGGNFLARSLFELFTNRSLSDYATGGPLWLGVYLLWWFVYLWGSVTIAGRTPGKALLGLRISSAAGGPLGTGRAAIRALTFPFSFVLGIGFAIGLLRDDLRCLHDLLARSQVMVHWGDRRTRLPTALEDWLTRHQPGDEESGDGGANGDGGTLDGGDGARVVDLPPPADRAGQG